MGEYINSHFVACHQRVAAFRIERGIKIGGNVASFLCAPDGRVIHGIAGAVGADTLLQELEWARNAALTASARAKAGGTTARDELRKLHEERFAELKALGARSVFGPQPQGENLADLELEGLGPTAIAEVRAVPAASPDERGLSVAPPSQAPVLKFESPWDMSRTASIHHLLSHRALDGLKSLYGPVFRRVLNERIDVRPVLVLDNGGFLEGL